MVRPTPFTSLTVKKEWQTAPSVTVGVTNHTPLSLHPIVPADLLRPSWVLSRYGDKRDGLSDMFILEEDAWFRGQVGGLGRGLGGVRRLERGFNTANPCLNFASLNVLGHRPRRWRYGATPGE